MTNKKKETFFSGIPISGGVVFGDAVIIPQEFRKKEMNKRIKHSEIPRETGRVKEALQILILINEYSERFLRDNNASSVAGIVETQGMLLEDIHLREKIYEIIESGLFVAEAAVTHVLDSLKHSYLSAKHAYMRERASDINDLKKSFIDALINPVSLFKNKRLEKPGNRGKKTDAVAVAYELVPRLVIEMNMEGNIRAIVTEHGGKTSHAAILCSALGITAVSGIKDMYNLISNGTKMLVNGDTGVVTLSPEHKTIKEALYAAPQASTAGSVCKSNRKNAGFRVMATINFANEVQKVLAAGADGIGLYRTEFESLAIGRFIDEEEQFERYKSVIQTMDGLPVYLRLVDIGRDKELPEHQFLKDNKKRHYSYGAQFLLDNPDIFQSQVRAIVRASEYGPINVIYPMIMDLDQFISLKRLFIEASSGIDRNTIKHGVMLELPSACLSAAQILEKADFGCIGTNDLTSYLFGIERNRDCTNIRKTANHPLLWNLITNMSKAAKNLNKRLIFCGELAKDPHHIAKLIDIGINTISVTPNLITGLKEVVHGVIHRNMISESKPIESNTAYTVVENTISSERTITGLIENVAGNPAGIVINSES